MNNKWQYWRVFATLILTAVFGTVVIGQSADNSQERLNAAGSVFPRPTPPVNSTMSDEEAAILPYYNNYLSEYHLGPEDVISVEVFGLPQYSRSNVIIPPTAKISYPQIPGGVFVGGKTTDEVAKMIARHLNEYIIDPEVTVTLEKVGSARFSVLGLVGTPGVKMMNRRYNIYEAVAEAGGIAKEGDKKRVLLIRLAPNGEFTQTVIDFNQLVKGKGEVPYILPGDQIIVPEKGWSLTKVLDTIGRVSSLRILFGNPL